MIMFSAFDLDMSNTEETGESQIKKLELSGKTPSNQIIRNRTN